MKFELVHNAWQVVTRAWFFRLTLLCFALGAAETGLTVLMGNPPMDPVHFAFLVSGVSLASNVARLVKQVSVSGPSTQSEGTV